MRREVFYNGSSGWPTGCPQAGRAYSGEEAPTQETRSRHHAAEHTRAGHKKRQRTTETRRDARQHGGRVK